MVGESKDLLFSRWEESPKTFLLLRWGESPKTFDFTFKMVGESKDLLLSMWEESPKINMTLYFHILNVSLVSILCSQYLF